MRHRPLPDIPQYVETLRCNRCHRVLPLSNYSMLGRRPDPLCNECQVAVSPARFLADPKIDNSWMNRDDLPCQSADPELFFPDSPQEAAGERWRPFCDGCPVRDQCAAYGSQTGSVGVWGGRLRIRADRSDCRLLRRGSCTHGHKVESEDDLVFQSRRGSYYALCAKCYDPAGHKLPATKLSE